MANDYQNGMSITILSVKYDIHRNTVRRNLQKLGFVLCDERTIPHSISEKLTAREKDAIDRLFYKNLSVSEIASAVGVSISQVKYYLSREKML